MTQYISNMAICGSGLKLMIIWNDLSENISKFHPLDGDMECLRGGSLTVLGGKKSKKSKKLLLVLDGPMNQSRGWNSKMFSERLSQKTKLQTATPHGHITLIKCGHRGGTGDLPCTPSIPPSAVSTFSPYIVIGHDEETDVSTPSPPWLRISIRGRVHPSVRPSRVIFKHWKSKFLSVEKLPISKITMLQWVTTR